MANSALTPEQLQRLLAAAVDTRLWQTPDAVVLNPLADRAPTGLTEERNFARGEIVFAEGTPGDVMYIVRSGRMVIFKDTLDAPIVLGFRGPGEIVGEMALIEDRPRTATAVAVEDSIALLIDRRNFLLWLAQQPSTGLNLLKTVSARLRDTDKLLSRTKADERQLQGQVSELQSERERLLELQRMRQDLVDFLVHDMRNPLTTIISTLTLLEMALAHEGDGEKEDMLRMAVTSAARLTRLIDTLLEVSRLESGNFPLTRSEIQLRVLLIDVAKQMEVLAQRNHVLVRVEAAEDLPPLTADRALLERVLANLMDNALKYTPPNGTIALSATVEGDYLLVAVGDTGPGVPPDQRERVFEWFAQIGGEKLKRRGFGLGLTFCRLAVEAHGGRIWVESGDDGAGTQFVFSLPLGA